jgi:hypothetical protein
LIFCSQDTSIFFLSFFLSSFLSSFLSIFLSFFIAFFLSLSLSSLSSRGLRKHSYPKSDKSFSEPMWLPTCQQANVATSRATILIIAVVRLRVAVVVDLYLSISYPSLTHLSSPCPLCASLRSPPLITTQHPNSWCLRA